MNKNSSMRLSEHDSSVLTVYGAKAYENSTYEFEVLLNNPVVTKESFTRVMNMCKSKTCHQSWKCIGNGLKVWIYQLENIVLP